MRMQKSSRITLTVAAIAAVMLAVAGTAIASNMGFKLNEGLSLTVAPPGAAQRGNNWVSIPYFNPYVTMGGLCTQTGLPSAGLNRAVLTDLDPSTGSFFTAQCGTTQANGRNLTPGRGLQIREPFNSVPVVSAIIIVGSHNPALSLNIPQTSTAPGLAQKGNLRFAVPYHTTAVTAQDLCNQIGMTNSGVNRGIITRLNAATGVFTSVSCGTSQATGFVLALGEMVQLRQPGLTAAGLTFIPAHF